MAATRLDSSSDDRLVGPDTASGQNESGESSPADSGHSTGDDQARRNQEDESPS